jgi:hypothetical protein
LILVALKSFNRELDNQGRDATIWNMPELENVSTMILDGVLSRVG